MERFKPSVGGLSSCPTKSIFGEANCEDISYPHEIDSSWLPEIFPEKQTLSFIQVQSARIIKKIQILGRSHYLVSAQMGFQTIALSSTSDWLASPSDDLIGLQCHLEFIILKTFLSQHQKVIIPDEY